MNNYETPMSHQSTQSALPRWRF